MSATATRPDIDVEPFTIDFDHEDNHCSTGVEFALQDLDEDVANHILAMAGTRTDDDDFVRYVIEERVEELKEGLEHETYDDVDGIVELIEALEDAAQRLDVCAYGCECTSFAVECWTEAVDERLGRLGNRHWAVLDTYRETQPIPQQDIDGELTYDDLDRNMALRSWSRFKVEWDGSELKAHALGRDGEANLHLVPLTESMRELANRWEEYDGYDECRLGTLLSTDIDALTVTLELWDVLDATCDVFTLSMDETIDAFTALPQAARRKVNPAVVAGLVDNGNWEGTAAQLLDVALAATAA